MIRSWSTAFAAIVASLAVCTALFRHKLQRLHNVNSLFHEANIAHNFRGMESLGFPHVVVRTRGAPVAEFVGRRPDDAVPDLPSSFEWNGTSLDLAQWLEEHWTTGLVVIKRDEHSPTVARLLHESYHRGNDARSRCVSWSMCKSVMSTLVGIAVDRGIIGDIVEETVTDYVPELKGSGYEGVSLKNVLEMSSGVGFNEDYFDRFSDINIMGYVLALGGSMDSFVATLKREREPGTFNHYVSMDTQVLGMVLMRAANQTLASFLEETLWSQVGFEASATWCQDNAVNRMELAFGVLSVTTRDYARFGWFMLNRGTSPATGERILSEKWVTAATSPSAPHLMPGDDKLFGYGYQWWVGPALEKSSKPGTDFLAIGVYGQMLYVSPEHGIVIAKNAAYPYYASKQKPGSQENYVTTQGYHAMRKIAQHFSNV